MLLRSFLGSVIFYTCIPLPGSWTLEFKRIARWAPLIGILLGAILGLVDTGLEFTYIPILPRSLLIIALWSVITGGLHLDGVSDTADGLAVQDPQKRLEVMQDSRTGAFGVIAVVSVILLKTLALSELTFNRTWGLMFVAGWGRWGQVIAIALYPYLKATGKGAFHKNAMQLPQDVLLGLFILMALSAVQFFYSFWWMPFASVIGGTAVALFTASWFAKRLGGHTGDTYGAVVEWTEAFLLYLLLIFQRAGF